MDYYKIRQLIMIEFGLKPEQPPKISKPAVQTRQFQIQKIQQCFRILHLDKQPQEIIVPSCVQFKINNFTDVNFQNLSAQVNGVLCISFFIFTHNKHLEKFLLERLYWNPEEEAILQKNRKKKIERKSNFLPVTFNKDVTVKLPTTRSKEFQIQAFKRRIQYKKNGLHVEGWRIFHIIRKEFTIEIIKSSAADQFWAPYNFINLDLTVSLDHMETAAFEYQRPKEGERDNIKSQNEYIRAINEGICKYYARKQVPDELIIQKINFNNLRLEEPMRNRNLPIGEKMRKLAPMIVNVAANNFGKYDVADTYMEAYTHDEREILDLEDQSGKERVFTDNQPTQLDYKPFKYAIFKIPLYRFPVVDMMTIFIPIWLLGFISVYVFYQTTEIMNRIINVAALMIAYAAVQPIVRENLPDATTLTLVDLLIYMEILTNILFLARSINLREYYDSPPVGTAPNITNAGYDRWSDGLFIASVVLTIVNVIIVAVLIIIYLINKKSYKGPAIKRKPFSISDEENWTLKLLMERSFARYNSSILEFDDIFRYKDEPQAQQGKEQKKQKKQKK